jgi:hypothetical protein
VLANKRIALSLCDCNLFDGYAAVEYQHALLSPLGCRAAQALIAQPARAQEIFRTVPHIGKELLRKGPGFAADLTTPPRQFWFANV